MRFFPTKDPSAKQMDYVSMVKLWADKHKKPQPNYVFVGVDSKWEARIVASWLASYGVETLKSGTFASKKMAKQDVAQKLYSLLKEEDTIHISPYEPVTILIDGDQRCDVTNWLASSEVTWSNDLKIIVFASPNSTLKETDQYTIVYSNSASRDSADALLLMYFGWLIYNNPEQHIIIVSADHIMCQAARDHGVHWAKDLASLKQLLLV